MKIFEALRRDHDKQRALIKLLLDTSGSSAVRREYYEQLKQALEDHAIAEERYFYAPLMKADETIEMSRHGIAEHHQIDTLIAQVNEADMSSPQWLIKFKMLADKVEHHLAEEETEFFQQAGRALTENDKTQLAEQYIGEMS